MAPSRLGTELADVAARALAAGDEPRAIEHLLAAADAHTAAGCWQSADELLDRAVGLLREAGGAWVPVATMRAQLATRQEREEAADRWIIVRDAARDAGDDDLLACALVHLARQDTVDCEELRLAASLGDASTGWAARARSIVAMADGRWQDALDEGRAACALARETRDRDLEAQASWGVSIAAGNVGDEAEALESCRHTIYLMGELHARALAEYARAGYVDMLAEALRLDEADRESTRLMFGVEEAGLEPMVPVAAALRALTLLRRGDLVAAEAVLDSAADASGGFDQDALLAVVAAHVAVERHGASVVANDAIERARLTCDAAGIDTYAIEVDIANVALDLAAGIDDGIEAARALQCDEPFTVARIALLLARHAATGGSKDALAAALERRPAIEAGSSAFTALALEELDAHERGDFGDLMHCATTWSRAGFLLDAARVRWAANCLNVGMSSDVRTDRMLSLVADLARMGAIGDRDRAARQLRGTSPRQALLTTIDTPLFDGVDPSVRRELARSVGQRRLRRGAAASGHDDRDGGVVLLVLTGRLRVSAIAPSGKVLTVDLLDPGAVWIDDSRGEDATIELVATETSELAVIPTAELERLAATHPQLGLNLARILGDRLARSHSFAERLAYWSVQDRFAQLLLEVADRYGDDVDGGGRRVARRFSQGELAELVGTRRETVNSLLVDLRRDGIVVTGDDQHLVIVDRDALSGRAAGT